MDKAILILGLGITGMSLVKFFAQKGIQPLLVDTRVDPPLLKELRAHYPNIECQQADRFNPIGHHLETAYASPGFPLHHPLLSQLQALGVSIHNDIELYVRQISNTPDKTLIAVTGTNGKSTVCSMLEHTLENYGVATTAAGNIGKPIIELLTSKTATQVTVLELSSFQLTHTHSLQGHSASVLNLAPDHLDKHKSIEEYATTKQRIYHNSSAQICNTDDQATWVRQPQDVANKYWFGLQQPPEGNTRHFATVRDEYLVFGDAPLLKVAQLPNPTLHNQTNALASIALLASINKVEAAGHLASYQHLKHRCQYLGQKYGRHFINDSKATNPHAAIHVIEGLIQSYSGLIVIAGGDAKNLALDKLGALLQQRVKFLVVMGKDADAILSSTGQLPNKRVANIQQAVEAALAFSHSGDCIALCPGCASTDMYRDYQARGDAFIACVESL